MTNDSKVSERTAQILLPRDARQLRVARIIYGTALLVFILSGVAMMFSTGWARDLDAPSFLDVLVFWALAEIGVIIVFLIALIVAMRVLRLPLWASVGAVALAFVPLRTIWFVITAALIEHRAYLATRDRGEAMPD